jgi:4-alpha-glucanotransferase
VSGAARPHLRTLADAAGILPEYFDAVTGERRITSDTTYEAILAAIGYDASSEDLAEATWQDLERERDAAVLSPVAVFARRPGRPTCIRFTPPEGLRGTSEPISCRLSVVAEDGSSCTFEGTVSASDPKVACPPELGLGYHHARLELRSGSHEWSGQQRLIIVPRRCYTARHALGPRRAAGLCANLYTVRSTNNWGVGDFADLAELCEWSGRSALQFVGVNPLHALRNEGCDVSPYSPVSRLFHNPIYLDVTAVPELTDSDQARRLMADAGFNHTLSEVRSSDHVEYARVMALKESVLRPLFAVFKFRHLPGNTERGRRFGAFTRSRGPTLDKFAAFQALSREMVQRGHEPDWHAWPAEFRDPRSDSVESFCRVNADELDYHRFLQFELDRQLGSVAAAASQRRMCIGLYQDLALGSARGGSDAWSNPGLFVDDVNLGAPPDDYARGGQDWSFPPLNPHRLRQDAYGYWRALVSRAMLHGGALRVDHAMGVLRQFWVPRGMSAANGAYVRFPHEDLLGILALESRRHRALVIGEDLGTVPEGFSALLARWGILSCRVMYFQRDDHGAFVPPNHYPRRALVTVNTHDHVPLAGFFSGDDLDLRRRVGDLATDEDLAAALARRNEERQALVARLVAEQLLHDRAGADSYDTLRSAVHAFLSRTPARLVGIMLDDLAAEREPVNLPGVGMDRFASWSRRMSRTLEELMADPAVAGVLTEVRTQLETGSCRES